MVNVPKFETFIINTDSLFESLKKYEQLVSSDLVVVDTETDSKVEKTANLYGFGIAFTELKGFYIPWRTPEGTRVWNAEKELEITDWLLAVCQRKKLINHNIIYDILVLENNLGIDLSPYIYSDTILMKHTLDEEQPFALKEIAVLELGEWADLAQDKLKNEIIEKGGRWTKDQKDMYLASTQTLGEYCCWDVILTLMLFNSYQPKLEAEGLMDLFYKEEIMPLYKEVTINMKRKGFPIDVEYYKKLKLEITEEISKLETDIYNLIKSDVRNFEELLLEEELPVKASGSFPKYYAKAANIVLPLNSKTNEVTLAKKAVEAQKAASGGHGDELYDHVLGITPRSPLDPTLVLEAQKLCFFDRNPESKTVFNLSSNDHLIELVFNQWGYVPKDKTPGGKPKIDDDYLESLKGNVAIDKLKDYKKLNKLLSTYVDGILDRQINGYIYTSMLQFGTTSGRYSSRDPNLQNQPRVKDEDSGLSVLVLKYVNAIRKGFVAGQGRKVVNADYSSLEPVCFAHVSGDEKLRNVFRNKEDLYSRIAIETFDLKEFSADKKSPQYLGLHKKEMRQTSKVFCLAVAYGAEAARISAELGVSYREAEEIINKYLNQFPGLRKYMNNCNYEAKSQGFVRTEFGRIRHLKEARSIYTLYGESISNYKYAKSLGLQDFRRKYKNCLNNAKNFPIQGLAAHIVNRAMIAISREFKKQNIDGWIGLQVHDEITCIVNDIHADQASKIIKDCMENTTKISVPLNADPLIADNWGEAK